MQIKFLQRLLRDRNVLLTNKRFLLIIIILLAFIHKIQQLLFTTEDEPNNNCCEPFDVVYTWVNGSDPDFVSSIRKYSSNYDPARFDDKDELKYSLRSLEKFAPWIRHIYIVTNGQIPHWLDLSNEKISIISHSEIAQNTVLLPTFSSSSIETFLYRIPNLSKRYLYLNDDIYLGAPLYPEDLYTSAEGVKVYTAWTVPDCTLGCPWVYIGDGSCDETCNVEECQYDGGDCKDHDESHSTEYSIHEVFYDVPKVKSNITALSVRYNPSILPRRRKPPAFNEFLKGQNTTDKQLKTIVDKFNNAQKKRNKAQKRQGNVEFQPTSSKDVYAQNLVHTNKIFNRIYGFKSRKVLAHVGFLLDRDVMADMVRKFQKEIDVTTSHRFRNPADIQFAFAYYHFLMNESLNVSVSQIFDELDTDGSSTWSDREIRTLLARIYPLPLDWAVVRYFEEIVSNCSKELNLAEDSNRQYTTLVYERYEDSNIPPVTKELVSHCRPLVEVLQSNFAERTKYKFHINQKTGIYSNFKMLTSNVSEVVDALDELRRNPKKFNCINDNLESQYPEENQLIKLILEDFYLSFFPKRSAFELPDNLRNRFTHIDDYHQWKAEKRITVFILYAFSAIMTAIGIRYCCYKAKYARKLIPYKCCDI